jgi:hypothetical protein
MKLMFRGLHDQLESDIKALSLLPALEEQAHKAISHFEEVQREKIVFDCLPQSMELQNYAPIMHHLNTIAPMPPSPYIQSLSKMELMAKCVHDIIESDFKAAAEAYEKENKAKAAAVTAAKSAANAAALKLANARAQYINGQ